ncbi:lantibiotic dehydratase [Micromonospora sp. RTGN7]|uniref:lantibiotic dehydratase n=1 Tax=Micromonospora sp. RTGN7 TaxID=3016526 RepID=UPI0029FF0C51|nr:lantibiotic dehydratase [Micromonospora sp. RTGN7]
MRSNDPTPAPLPDPAPADPHGQPAADLTTALGGTGWVLWRDAALRGAGFPADGVLEICDDALAAAADRADDEYPQAFADATGRLSAAIRRTASDDLFREAVTWQNPVLVPDCLDKAAAGEPRNVRGRNHELTIASYLQRYCLKNDTIGFFGPVCWARLGTGAGGVDVRPGPQLLGRRTTYFENWAVDALADAIAARPEVFPWLRPQREPSASVAGAVVRLPFRKPVKLSPRVLRVLQRCDGERTVRDLAGDPPDPAVLGALLELRRHGVVRMDLRGPIVTWPELELAQRLDTIGDPAARDQAHASLRELVQARDAVAAAAGAPTRLAEAGRALATTFERTTGVPATRRASGVYAARTLVYEDTVRAADVRVGQAALDRLAEPLGLVLDSAAWLANAIADEVEKAARELLEREPAGRGVPLLKMLTSLLPELGGNTGAARSQLVEGVVADFQRRWARVLGVPADGAQPEHRTTAAAIAGLVAQEFPRSRPRWSGARYHSPDIMVVAADTAALVAGDVDFVLGEVHCTTNTLGYKMWLQQHPEPERVRAAVEAMESGDRLVLIPGTDSPLTTTRMSAADETMLPGYTYLCLGAESLVPPPGATAIGVLDLDVVPGDSALLVRHRTTGATYSFLEALGDPLSALASDAFRPFARAARRPRVSIDSLVLGRAARTFDAGEQAWAFLRDESQRYAAARRWRATTGLPERAFVRVPVERKPMAVDFRSLPLVNLLAKVIRRTAEAGAGEVTVTEMLPDLDMLWLRDTAGNRYTAELRLIAVRP